MVGLESGLIPWLIKGLGIVHITHIYDMNYLLIDKRSRNQTTKRKSDEY